VGVVVGQRSWTGDEMGLVNHWSIAAPCGLTYYLEGGTRHGAIGAFVGLYCDVVCNAIVIVVQSVILQYGKRVVAPWMLLVDRLQELDICRCLGVMQCGRHSNWGDCWWGGQ
jgi:hypothetical protein